MAHPTGCVAKRTWTLPGNVQNAIALSLNGRKTIVDINVKYKAAKRNEFISVKTGAITI